MLCTTRHLIMVVISIKLFQNPTSNNEVMGRTQMGRTDRRTDWQGDDYASPKIFEEHKKLQCHTSFMSVCCQTDIYVTSLLSVCRQSVSSVLSETLRKGGVWPLPLYSPWPFKTSPGTLRCLKFIVLLFLPPVRLRRIVHIFGNKPLTVSVDDLLP